MNIQIREMAEADIPVVSEMEQMYFTDSWSADGIGGMMRLSYITALVAEIDEQLQGYCFFSFLYQEGELLNIAVREDSRNLKIGTKLLEAGIQLGSAKGVTAILLEVRESNLYAQQFYRAKAFEKIGIRKDFYEKPNENAITMKRLLSES